MPKLEQKLTNLMFVSGLVHFFILDNDFPNHFWHLLTNLRKKILPVLIKADWDYTNDDKSILDVKNVDEIIKCFTEFA